MKKTISEKPHRLLKESYTGCVRASFTICIHPRINFFNGNNENVINYFLDVLKVECEKEKVINWIYVFMPDHIHMILEGTSDNSNLWQLIKMFKQKTGFFLSKNFGMTVKWQKDFYDYIHREKDKLKWQMKYIANNPVRKDMVNQWNKYKYVGSIHKDLVQMINCMD